MSVQMALAEATHHTAPRGQGIARAREEERETKYTVAFRATVPPPEPVLFDLFEEPGGGRPNFLLEPQGPQAGIQHHTMEHIADVVPMVQILDIPVLLGADQLVKVGRHLDLPISEQVIQVPKIPSAGFPWCKRRRNSWWKCRRLSPILCCGLSSRPWTIQFLGFGEEVVEVYKGFRPGQGIPAAGVEQIVEFPVPQRRRKRTGGFQGFFPGQYSTADVEQNVDIPARGGLHGFLPGQGSSSSSRFPGAADEVFAGGFALFSVRKKVRGWVRTRGRN